MNMGTPFAVSPQPVMSDGQSVTPVANESGTDSFSQMLTALTTGTTNLVIAPPNPTPGLTWPLALLEILGQSPNACGPALDLPEEAPNLAGQLQEATISLTEIMTVLQPIIASSELALPEPVLSPETFKVQAATFNVPPSDNF